MARPVVASPGAFEGIEAEPGRDLLVADDAEAQAEAILAPARRRRSAAARDRRGRARRDGARPIAGTRGSRRSPAIVGLAARQGGGMTRARHPAARRRRARPGARISPRSASPAAAILLLFCARRRRHRRDLVEQLDLQPLPADPADHRLAGLAAPARASRSSRPPPGRRACSWSAAGALGLAARRGGRRRLRPPSRPGLSCSRARSIACLGKAVARGLAFPLFYALFLVPVGEELVPRDADRHRRDRAWPCSRLTGVPAHLEGIFITTPTGYFEVAEACAGVKFLIAMARLRRAGRQCLLPLLAAPDRLHGRRDRRSRSSPTACAPGARSTSPI